MRFELCISVVITIILQRARCQEPEECIEGHSARYVGTRSVTASGRTCQRWDATTPHQPIAKNRPHDGRRHNYCRNPDNDLLGTWCYTTDITKRWEYCNITKCVEDSYLYWTSFDSTNTQTLILSAHADPEVMRRQMTSSKTFNTTTVVDSNETNAEYWALTSHPRRKQLYYTDYRQEYLAVWDINKGEERRYFEGITHGIENLAIDWKTDNLYWTDSAFKWIMAADSHFKHYAVVYRPTPKQVPYGLTIHQTRRYMIFSTYEAQRAKMVRTDLAGKDAVDLFIYPDVMDVTGITIDYEDDRLYWTDFTGYGGKIMSSRLDGSNKTEHKYFRGSILWGLVTSSNFVYSTDVHTRYDEDGKRFYRLWFKSKWSTTEYNYRLPTKPRGIAVLRGNEETAYRNDSNSGECDQNHGCDHVCLPRINSSSECACSLGYQLASDKRRCIYNLLDDNYLIFADHGQGKVFQMSIDDADDKNSTAVYNIVPLDDTQKINKITLDINRGYVFWSSKKTRSLYRANIDGKERLKIADVYAIRLAVDPQTGNVFYADEDANSIVVSKGDGSFKKTIRNKTAEKYSIIGMITVDVKNKYIYWTQRFTDTGRLMRCKFDGSAEEVVLDGLKSPHATTVDYQTDKLYVVEAKAVRIFEVALSLLDTISNTSISGSNFRVYDIGQNFASPYIADFKLLGGIAYMGDSKNRGFRTFNFSSQVAPNFGPKEFVEITTISIFKKSFYNDYIEPVPNPCSTNPCQGLCLALNANDSRCICGDGKADSDCVTEKATVTTDASTNAVAKENATGHGKPHHTTPIPTTSPGGINAIVNSIWAIILRAIKLCKSENSICFQ